MTDTDVVIEESERRAAIRHPSESAAMTITGIYASVAVPFLYRIATFWLAILPGPWTLRTREAGELR